MAEAKTPTLEREYIIPLRREFRKVSRYRRTGRAVQAIKKFIAKHMKVPERDVSNVRIDMYLNNEIWYRGRQHPPAKVKVKAIKEGDIVRVTFVEVPEHVKFAKLKEARMHTKVIKKEEKKEEKAEVRTEEQKKNEVEKEKATEVQHAKEAKVTEKAKEHTTKFQKEIHPFRMALKK